MPTSHQAHRPRVRRAGTLTGSTLAVERVMRAMRAQSALPYLLPDAGLLVGVGERTALVRQGRASVPVERALRPLRAADPPILGVFPPRLAAATAPRARISVRTSVPKAQDGRSAWRRGRRY